MLKALQQAGCSATVSDARQWLQVHHLRGDTGATIHGPDDYSGTGHSLDTLAHTVHAIIHQVHLQGRYWQCLGLWQASLSGQRVQGSAEVSKGCVIPPNTCSNR